MAFPRLCPAGLPSRNAPYSFSSDPALCSADCLLSAVQLSHRAILRMLLRCFLCSTSLIPLSSPVSYLRPSGRTGHQPGFPARGPHVSLFVGSGHLLAVCGGLQPLRCFSEQAEVFHAYSLFFTLFLCCEQLFPAMSFWKYTTHPQTKLKQPRTKL